VSVEAPSAVAVAAPTPVQVRVPMDVPTRLVTVYIRQRETAHLVAVIELLSPVNKRRGKGREEYLDKRRTFLTSPVHVVEIDLLRRYPRMPFDDPLPPDHLLVMVCKAGERPPSSVWPITVRQPLPPLPIPLAAPSPPGALGAGAAPAQGLGGGSLGRARNFPPAACPAIVTGRYRLGGSAAKPSRKTSPTRRPVEGPQGRVGHWF